ncbi:uncharacterized protein V1516DRAFT_484629 [Lipomyces oligophaga]|uniref:uncharacterized protein n=1 Tax=Lipomyces oligophaga TaxID=45792 RepID=UPI0034CE8F4B
MSKYWCKPCKSFVLDTKLGKSQHEISSKHKSSIDRTLKDLHRQKVQQERNDRDAKRILNQIEKTIGSSSSLNANNNAHSTNRNKLIPQEMKSDAKVRNLVASGRNAPAELVRPLGNSGKISKKSKKPTVLGALPDGPPFSDMKGNASAARGISGKSFHLTKR